MRPDLVELCLKKARLNVRRQFPDCLFYSVEPDKPDSALLKLKPVRYCHIDFGAWAERIDIETSLVADVPRRLTFEYPSEPNILERAPFDHDPWWQAHSFVVDL